MYSFYNGGLPNPLDNYFAEIASVKNSQTGVASLQKYYLPGMKTSLGQLSLKYMYPTLWSKHSWKFEIFFASFIWQTIETSCYLARIPVDFRFTYLWHSVALSWCQLFTSNLPLQWFTPHPIHRHNFPPLLYVAFCAYYTWLKPDVFLLF